MKIYSFSVGGIVVEDSTVPPKDASVIAFLPGLSVIPLVQHTGSRAYPIVSVGDFVTEGMLIGRCQGPGSANIHATVPGRVVRMVSWKMAEGYTNDALVIRMEGSFEMLGKRQECYSWQGLSPDELCRLISECGIVEMEGMGEPAADMIASLGKLPEPYTLVVRCVFDDPWLAADYTLCRERLKAVAEGSVITALAARVSRIIFAVSHREKDLGDKLMAEAASFGIPVSLVPVSSRYPQKNRRELEYALRMYGKKEAVELGSLLILGPATLAAVHDAVKLRKPILDRYVAVGGSAVKTPQVMRVRIGTRIGEVFAECGGFIDTPRRIATGSPIMGRSVVDLDEPVVKTTTGVFAILRSQMGGTRKRNCIGCGECRTVCPVGLDPEALYKGCATEENREFHLKRAGECHGCGCCEVVCPSRLPLSTAIRNASPPGSRL
ncbi:MAG: SLBB domain-containing protein [Spirochaetaceae bacterium]|jgi:electron transport complex protein RnfC|nr:SLBB domain-containing protein [Spirochaetaceae bacterium]